MQEDWDVMPGDDLEPVSIRGRVQIITAFGMFFDGRNRRFFVPTSMLPRNCTFKPGEDVKLYLARAYVRQEGLIA
jgi:hypothetical protein